MWPLAIQSVPTKYGSLLEAPSAPRPMRYSSLSLKDIVYLCANPRDDEAWEELVSRVDKPIALTIMRTLWGERSLAEVQDLRQSTYMKLCKDGCCLLRDIAIKCPDDNKILRYIRKTAATTTLDRLKHYKSQKCGGDRPHVSTDDVDPEDPWKQERIEYQTLLTEIDGHLKHCLTGPDQKRDRTIFWFYFLQGMSTEEIASVPTIGLTAKGVGAVIERLKHCIREQIVGFHSDSDDDKD